MFRFVFLVIVASVAAVDPDTEFMNINRRVPGDQLILKSNPIKQNLDFYGKTTYEIHFPDNDSRSQYMITHIHIDAKENTGMMDASTYGGPGSDFLRLKLISNSVKNGSYVVYIYGKKK